MHWTIILIFVAAWMLIGLAIGLWMARHGHAPLWILIAVILGPLFAPIAYERIERRPRSIEAAPAAQWATSDTNPDELRVMVGFDGSTHAQEALQVALRLFPTRRRVLELVAVVSYDDSASSDSEAFDRVKKQLADAASSAVDVPIGHAILTGPAGESLCWYAADQRADVLVVGSNGGDISNSILGSVAEYVVAHSPIPVLVGRVTANPDADTGSALQRS